MEKSYRLEVLPTLWGRTLWNNLVVGNMTSTLDSKDYMRLTPIEQMRDTCEFQYKDIAKITVIQNNKLKIEAKTEEKLREAESSIKEICNGKGCPIFDVN